MLDSDTKRRIDSARQILVGKVPDPKGQVEQITTALIYKFMDDMDKEAQELGGEVKFFTGEYEKYAWSRLMDVRLGGQARLNLYTEGLENLWQNKNLPPLFRQIFKSSFLPFRDPETLNLFLKEINGFVYDHSERLGDAYEYLLSVLGTQGDAGQFRTPRHIIDFIVEAVNPTKDDTILDPACGTAGFLISAYKHILKSNRKERPGDTLTHSERTVLMNHFTGYDISPDMVRLSLVNMYLHGFPLPNIVEYDTLGQEERWDDSFNVILANPPFMTPKGGVMPHKRFSVQAKRSEVLFVDYIADHLTPNGRAGVIVPEGIIFQSGNAYKQLRKMLVEGYLYAVVSLPAGVFNPYSGVKTSVLLLDKNIAKRSTEIAFVKVENDGFDLGATKRPIAKNDLPQALEILKAWKEGGKMESSLAVYVEKAKIIESGDFNLSGDRYRENKTVKQGTWPMVELGKIAKVFVDGNWVESKDQAPEGIRLVQTGNIGIGEYLDKDGRARFITEKKFKELGCTEVFPGDILISRLPDPVGRACMVPALKTRMITAVDCTIVRFDPSKYLPQFFVFLSHTNHYFAEIQQYLTGSSRVRISRSNLAKVKIPLPPLEVQRQIVEELDGYQKIISGARQVVENWKPRIEVEEGWERVKLGEVTEILNGYAFKSENYVDDGIRVIRITNVQKGDIVDDNPKFYPLKSAEPVEKFKLCEDDLLISLTGNVGRIGLLPKALLPAALNQRVACLRMNEKRVERKFLFFWLNQDSFENDCVASSAGVAQKNLSTVWLSKYEIPLPPFAIQKQIVEKIEAERALVEAAKKLIGMYEGKMKERVGRVWGAESSTETK